MPPALALLEALHLFCYQLKLVKKKWLILPPQMAERVDDHRFSDGPLKKPAGFKNQVGTYIESALLVGGRYHTNNN